jgi:hypothetical protein
MIWRLLPFLVAAWASVAVAQLGQIPSWPPNVRYVAAGPTLSFSGPSSGTVSVASTNFTAALTGTTFSGTQTVTITDSATTHGTFAPSVGTCGTAGTCTVTPAAAATGFTFTYTPAQTGAITLTFTNSAAWTESPSSLVYTSNSAAGCAQYTALAARMDGSQNAGAVQTLICGLVTDSTYSLFDGLYVFGTNSTTNANLNWAQNAFNLTKSGTCTFTANAGYTGDAASCVLTPNFIPLTNGVAWTANSGTVGSCVLTSRAVVQNYVSVGVSDSTNNTSSFLQNYTGTGYVGWEINGATFTHTTISNSQGAYYATRTGSTAAALYQNGTSIATPTDASTGRAAIGVLIMAFNNAGITADWTADQVGYAFFGGGLTSGQASSIYSRLHTYLSAVGAPSGC